VAEQLGRFVLSTANLALAVSGVITARFTAPTSHVYSCTSKRTPRAALTRAEASSSNSLRVIDDAALKPALKQRGSSQLRVARRLTAASALADKLAVISTACVVCTSHQR
jgi:hypothetical protein